MILDYQNNTSFFLVGTYCVYSMLFNFENQYRLMRSNFLSYFNENPKNNKIWIHNKLNFERNVHYFNSNFIHLILLI